MVLITLINISVSYIYFKELKLISSILMFSSLLPINYPINNLKLAHNEMNANTLSKQDSERF